MSQDGQPLINLRPSTGQCSCGSGKVKRFGYPPTQVDQGRKGPVGENQLYRLQDRRYGQFITE